MKNEMNLVAIKKTQFKTGKNWFQSLSVLIRWLRSTVKTVTWLRKQIVSMDLMKQDSADLMKPWVQDSYDSDVLES